MKYDKQTLSVLVIAVCTKGISVPWECPTHGIDLAPVAFRTKSMDAGVSYRAISCQLCVCTTTEHKFCNKIMCCGSWVFGNVFISHKTAVTDYNNYCVSKSVVCLKYGKTIVIHVCWFAITGYNYSITLSKYSILINWS